MVINEDEPGCSYVAPDTPPVRPKIAWAQIEDTLEPEGRKLTPLDHAWNDLVERVSVDGWKESFSETILWIRWAFRFVMAVVSLCCFYYIGKCILRYTRSGYIDKIQDFVKDESLPFTNVTICAQVYFNETFLRGNLTMPKNLLATVEAHGFSEDEFYRQLTLFMTPIIRPQEINRDLLWYFSKVIRANPQTEDYSSFATDAWVQCESMLKRCWFDGKEFDCCKKAVTSFDDDGICFQLTLNMDSDNAYPDPRTFQQRSPGPGGGLVVETSLETRDFPWLDDDAQNGFRILAGHTPYSVIAQPVVAPHGAETFVKVTSEKHLLATNCAPWNRLSLPFENIMYYDPEGAVCSMYKALTMSMKLESCHFAGYLYRPNRTIVCPPIAVYAGTQVLAQRDLVQTGKDLLGLDSRLNTRLDSVDPEWAEKKIQEINSELESSMKAVYTSNSFCPKHCQYWSYSSTASFIYLENRTAEMEHPRRMYSKIHVYYANMNYRQHAETREITMYLAFCDFGNIIGLYWGMSIVSFFHVFYYVPKYLYDRRRLRRKCAVEAIVLSTVR